jgi:hypothetical protein
MAGSRDAGVRGGARRLQGYLCWVAWLAADGVRASGVCPQVVEESDGVDRFGEDGTTAKTNGVDPGFGYRTTFHRLVHHVGYN